MAFGTTFDFRNVLTNFNNMKAQMIAVAMFLNLIAFSKSTSDNRSFQNLALNDDIPYFTTELAFQFNLTHMVIDSIKHAEELYVDDIPFDTEAILASYRSDSAMIVNYELTDEAVINDIPFDTQSIAANNLDKRKTVLSRND